MSNGLELHDSRVSHIEWLNGVAVLHFSHACIHTSQGKPGRDPSTLWSREAELFLWEATISGALPPLPNAIDEGFLEVGGIRHEVIPLPFKRKVGARLYLRFADGATLEIIGKRPYIELLGTPIYLEDS
ncbi:MAG: hypothetical protein ACM3KD_12240 [Hyphomicrobiaceae bacterium]